MDAEVSSAARNLRCTPWRFREPAVMARLSAGAEV
jgi:hypothetical protein